MTESGKRLEALVALTNRIDQLQRTVGRMVAHQAAIAHHLPLVESQIDGLEHDIRRELAAAKEAVLDEQADHQVPHPSQAVRA